ncbi:MAG: hypothetical protein ACK5B9_15175 [Flavobacteriia bacterium]|jgi:hypothetical protein
MKIITLSTFLLLSFLSFSQTILKIEDSEQKYRKDSLQEVYFNRIFSDEITTCFDVSQEMFIVEWSKFTRAVSKYLHEQNFVWGKKYLGNIEVYFNKDEKIEFFFLTMRDKEYPQEQYDKLFALLKQFAQEYTFKIDAKIPFSNSGTITFID